MTFKEFQQSKEILTNKQFAERMGMHPEDLTSEVYVYDKHYYIEPFRNQYSLLIGREYKISESLEELERKLYEWVQEENGLSY